MPKFYHGEQFGLRYRARAVGFWRRFPFCFLPYLTGDEIRIHLSVKPLFEGTSWQHGILQIEPPELSEDEPPIRLSDDVFSFAEYSEWSSSTAPQYHFAVNKWWSRTLSLKGGTRFHQPGDFECTLVFQNVYGGKVEQTGPAPIASIEVVSRGPFFTKVIMWVFGLLVSGLLGYLIAVLTRG